MPTLLGGAFEPRRFELVTLLPPDDVRQRGGLPSKHEAEASHRAVPGKIHVGTVLVAGLVVVLLVVFVVLLQAPGFVMALILQAFVDGERRNPDAGETEVIGTIVVTGFRMSIRTNSEAEIFRRGLYGAVERRALGT